MANDDRHIEKMRIVADYIYEWAVLTGNENVGAQMLADLIEHLQSVGEDIAANHADELLGDFNSNVEVPDDDGEWEDSRFPAHDLLGDNQDLDSDPYDVDRDGPGF